MEDYFSKFPQIIYNDVYIRDISRRVIIPDNVSTTPTLYYPYEIKSGQRSDVLAHAYYDNSKYDWLLYLTNGIIDPYYGWYLSDEQFDLFIIEKYGSIRDAMQRIKHFQLNWYDETPNIPVSVFENNIAYDLKKYYVPEFGYGSRIIAYSRRKEDWIVNTNKIIQFTVNTTSSNTFSNGELAAIHFGGNTVGNCEIITANSTVLIVQHALGNTSSNNFIVGDTSEANADILESTLLQQNLSDDEYVFWNPIYYYDYEKNINESRKFIQIIDQRYTFDIEDSIREKLKED